MNELTVNKEMIDRPVSLFIKGLPRAIVLTAKTPQSLLKKLFEAGVVGITQKKDGDNKN